MGRKRTRGAQPGNRNALKHGLYSSRLDEEGREALREAQQLDPAELRGEIDLLRARLAILLSKAPNRFDLVLVAARAIALLAATRYRLSPKATDDLAQSMANVIQGIGAQLFPERFADEAPGTISNDA